ncbi:MAG: YfcE family phosphodiesterase [Thermoleophilia bacterium]
MPEPSPTIRVGVVSDTHVGDVLPSLPAGVAEALAGVDLVIHAGDITVGGVLRELARIAPVVAVRGNHDRAMRQALPDAAVVRVGDVRIGVCHGHRPSRSEVPMVLGGLVMGRPTVPGLRRHLLRATGPVDVVVFGHFHMRYARRTRGVLMFSPGGAYAFEADPSRRVRGLRGRAFARYRRHLEPERSSPSVGILEITGREVAYRWIAVPGALRPRPPA